MKGHKINIETTVSKLELHPKPRPVECKADVQTITSRMN